MPRAVRVVETRCGRTEMEGSLFTVVVSAGGQREGDGGLCCLLLFYASDFQLCSSHGTHKLITEFCSTPKSIFFANMTKKLEEFHLYWMVIVLAVVIFYLTIRKKRSVTLTE